MNSERLRDGQSSDPVRSSDPRREYRTVNRIVVALIVAAVLLTGCQGRFESADPCECPNLEAVATSIDWLGDGTPPSDSDTDYRGSDDPRVLAAYVSYSDVGDGPAAQTAIAQRMIDAGFTLTDDTGGKWVFETDDWLVRVRLTKESSDATESYPWVWVQISDDDRAAEILSPITNALGTIP